MPVLPTKISGTNEDELNRRQEELELYMGQVLDLMSGQAQFNEALLSFIGLAPRDLGEPSEGRADVSPGRDNTLAATDAYYNAIDYCFAKDQTRVGIKSHGIRLDQNQKPKNFFLLEVSFNNASKPLGAS